MIFVFGSNYAGRHGKGAALTAKTLYGAKEGQARGLQGSSYGIPTKDYSIRTLDLTTIKREVQLFINFTHAHPELQFCVTAVGTGLARYKHSEIAPLFLGAATKTCTMPIEWKPYMNETYTYRNEPCPK
jgi:hypothetical protein